jgi:hypothetical protein
MIDRNHFRGKIAGTLPLRIGNKLETLGKKVVNVWEVKKCAYLWGN